MNRTDEWYDVEAVTENGYRIVEGGGYGLFLAEGTDRSVVIDAGIGIGDLRGLVAELVETPVTLLLTHSHWDHIGSAARFDDVRVHETEIGPDGRVAIDSHSDQFVERPAEFVEGWRADGNELPEGFDPSAYAIKPVEDPTPVAGGDGFELGDRRLETVHTPGHSPGHLALLDGEAGVLYGGDVVHRDAGLYVHLEGGDLRAYRETFARLAELRDDGAFDTLLTSHNPPFAGEELAVIDRLERGLERILDGEADPERVETDFGTADRYEFGESVVLTEPSET